MSVKSSPRASSHARLRFLQRAGTATGSLHRAWRDGQPVDVEGHDYHRARYDPLLDVVLLARDGIVTTVLKGAFAQFERESATVTDTEGPQ